jgi:hypothetical protein
LISGLLVQATVQQVLDGAGQTHSVKGTPKRVPMLAWTHWPYHSVEWRVNDYFNAGHDAVSPAR